jgi:hypothetical protein
MRAVNESDPLAAFGNFQLVSALFIEQPETTKTMIVYDFTKSIWVRSSIIAGRSK